MTKIYLVKKVWFDKEMNYHVVNLEAFTNKNKAKVYCEYKNLLEKEDNSIIHKYYKCCKYVTETMTICKMDCSENLQELQIKNLPY